jgi:hypothetical protein
MQTPRDPYMAPLCLAALLLSTYACRGMGESQRAPAALQVRALELVTEDGQVAATLAVREGSVVLELIGAEGAGILLSAGKEGSALAIQRDGESRVVMSESAGGAYIALESASVEGSGSSLLLGATPDNGEEFAEVEEHSFVVAEAGDSVTQLGAFPDSAGLSASWNDGVEAAFGASRTGAVMRLAFGGDGAPGAEHEVRMTASATGTELPGAVAEDR